MTTQHFVSEGRIIWKEIIMEGRTFAFAVLSMMLIAAAGFIAGRRLPSVEMPTPLLSVPFPFDILPSASRESSVSSTPSRPIKVEWPSEYIDKGVKPKVLTKQPFEYLEKESIPEYFDWRDVNGMSYVTRDLNQHIPVYCGSCWAHAALSALADRHIILQKAQWPDVEYSIQVVLNCAQKIAGDCHRGDPLAVYQFAHDTGLPEETCQAYKAIDEECIPINICRDCVPPCGDILTCSPVSGYTRHSVSEYGIVSGEENMMAEIYDRGPIACLIDATALHTYYGGYILTDTEPSQHNHVVSITGWGVANGMKYWDVQNSWGTYWGEKGWFRIIKGVNALDIEEHCYWAVPKDGGYCFSAHGHKC